MLNIWAILVGTLLYVSIGALWYSTWVFGKTWVKLLNLDPEKLKMSSKDMILSILGSLLATFALALILELAMEYSLITGLAIGALVGGILFAANSSEVIYSKKHWKLYLIDTGYHAFSLVLLGILLGIWN